MGMAASQARFLSLTARKSNVEYEGQQINQQRTTLGNQSANYYNQMLGMGVPVPPSVADYTKTVYTFSDGALTNSITSLIAGNNGLYNVSYLREWQDNCSIVSASSPIVTDKFDGKYRVGAQTLHNLGGLNDPDIAYQYNSLVPINYSADSNDYYTTMDTAQAANTNPAYDKFYTDENKSLEGQHSSDAWRAAADGTGSAQDALASFVINDRAIIEEAAKTGNAAAIDILNTVTMVNTVPLVGALTYADGTPTLYGKWSSITASARSSAASGGMDEYYRICQSMAATFYDPNPSDINSVGSTYNGVPTTKSGNIVWGATYNPDGSVKQYNVYRVYTKPGNTTYTSSTGATITLDRNSALFMDNQAGAETMGEVTDKLLEKDANGNYKMLCSPKPEELQPGYFDVINNNNTLTQQQKTDMIKLISNYERDAAGNVIYDADGPKLKSMLQKSVDIYQISTSATFSLCQPTAAQCKIETDADGQWITDLNGEKIYKANGTAEFINFNDPATKAKLDAAVAAGTLYNKGTYYSLPNGETISNGCLAQWSGNPPTPSYIRWGNVYNTACGLPYGDLEANYQGGLHNAASSTDVSFMGILKSFEDDFAYNLWLEEVAKLKDDWANNPDASLYDRLDATQRDALFGQIADKLDAFYATFTPTPVSYTGDDPYLNSLTPEQLSQTLEQEREYAQMLNQKLGAPEGGWLARYVQNTTTGEWEPVFYSKKDLEDAIYRNQTAGSLSYIPAYKIGTQKENSEIKNVEARIEQDSSGRPINITLNPGTPGETTYALTTNTVTDQAAYDDAMNQYEYDKYRYDQTNQELNAKISIIQTQDKNLELRLKQLDTEHDAIQTEMDAVAKVIQKNVESTFKTFG